jgi:hypothetical protein
LAARGILPPAWAGLLESIWLGVAFSVLIWFVAGFFRMLGKLAGPSPAAAGKSSPTPASGSPPVTVVQSPRKTSPVPTVAGVAATAPPEPIPLPVAPEQVIAPASIFTETPNPSPLADIAPAAPLPPFPSDGKAGSTDSDAPSK